MPWPTMSDYQDALQNPRLSFSDQELQRGVPVTDRLGLPKPVTGGFASVYQVNCQARKWAVRCFLHYHQDMEQRYASIGRCLSDARLPYTAGFQYLRNGIRIRGQWYPALKMEWVDGEPLNVYVERVRGDRNALLQLLDQFTHMTRDLRRSSIAHGDLQHGNIMVVGGALKLVDYDGMYVPDLRGMPSHEVGHPNYQHPGRNEKDFGPYLDNFSEWVIHLSLVALSIQPELWDLSNGGDEQLLFSRRDFADPKSSKVLKVLCDSPSEPLRQLSTTFRSVLACGDIAQIPPVDGAKPIFSRLVFPGSTASVARPTDVPAGPTNTWTVVGPNAPGLVTHSGQGNGSLPEWVHDHIDPSEVEIAPPFRVERISLAASVVLAALLVRFAALGYLTSQVAMWASIGGVFLAVSSLGVRYRARDELRHKMSLMAGIWRGKRDIRSMEAAIRAIEQERQRVKLRESQVTGTLSARISVLASHENDELARIDRWLLDVLGSITRKREELNKAEAAELASAASLLSLLLLGRQAESIMNRYKAKREPLLKQEGRVKLDAAHRRDAVRLKYARKADPLKQRLTEATTRFAGNVSDLDRREEQRSQELNLAKWNLQNFTRELSLYSRVTFLTYLKKIFYLEK